jgi:hypothetical protein
MSCGWTLSNWPGSTVRSSSRPRTSYGMSELKITRVTALGSGWLLAQCEPFGSSYSNTQR